MTDYLAIDIDDDPVEASTSERFVFWLAGLRRMPEAFFAFYDRWLERRCRSCGEERVMHAEYVMGGCRVQRGS